MEMNLHSLPLRKIFPLILCREDKLVSRYGDITIGWYITLPPMFSIDRSAYDSFILTLQHASRLLPDWTIIHKQDSFLEGCYRRSRSSDRRLSATLTADGISSTGAGCSSPSPTLTA